MLSPEEVQRIQRTLDLNERLVWCGKPMPKGFNRITCSMMLFAIPWLAICGTVSVLFLYQLWFSESNEPLLLRIGLSLFFVPFWCIGIGMLGAPLWLRLRQRRWLYAVTDKSARIVGAFRCTSWRRQDLFAPDRSDHRNGLTDILFATATYAVNGHHPPVGFVNLPTAEATAAEQALRALAGKDDAPPAS